MPFLPYQRLLLTLLLATVVLAGQMPLASAQAQQTDPRFGAVQAISSPDKAAQAGVRWERIIFPWAEMQPDSPDQLLQGYYSDAQIDGQIKRGISLVGVVLYTPGWAATDPSKGGSSVPKGLDRAPNDPQNYWARYMAWLGRQVQREDRHLDRLERAGPDRPGYKTQHNWAGSEAEFWQLQKSAYLAVQAGQPEAKVLDFRFSYWHAKQAGLEPS